MNREPLDFAPARVELTERADGTTIVRSPMALEPYVSCVTEWLRAHAERAPEQVFLAERVAEREGFSEHTYRAIWDATQRAAGWLLERGASVRRPLMILSDNSVDNAVLQLAAQHVGVPVAPISPAYSLMSRDHAKLRAIAELVRPAVAFVDDPARFAAALSALESADDFEPAWVCSVDPPAGFSRMDELVEHAADLASVERAHGRIGPESIAKILFTSGSTGEPKGVINTHRMLTSNQQMIAQLWRFLATRPPVLVDWLPWNHTFGANHNFFMVLRNGGALYINDGKPVPALVGRTVENLRRVAPTLYFDVPRGFEMLLPHLERDEALRTKFFSRLDLMFYAGAALPQSLWDRMERVSRLARGTSPVPMVSAWGATETSPLVTSVHFPIPRAGVIGLPAPGVELKLVPDGTKLEMRVRGPNVTPGYFRRDDLSDDAFDEEGFYKIGDAGRFADPRRPERGLIFDGRVAESFKLTTGTWVHAGTLRIQAVAACSPVVSDAVVTGHDRDEVGLLLIPNLEACRRVSGDSGEDLATLLAHPEVWSVIREGLGTHNASAGGSSQRIARARFLLEPLSIDATEITDKGYVNQRAVLERRAADVEALYRGAPGSVILGSSPAP